MFVTLQMFLKSFPPTTNQAKTQSITTRLMMLLLPVNASLSWPSMQAEKLNRLSRISLQVLNCSRLSSTSKTTVLFGYSHSIDGLDFRHQVIRERKKKFVVFLQPWSKPRVAWSCGYWFIQKTKRNHNKTSQCVFLRFSLENGSSQFFPCYRAPTRQCANQIVCQI